MSAFGVLGAGTLFGVGTPLIVASFLFAAPVALGILGGIAVAMSVNYLFTGSFVPEYF